MPKPLPITNRLLAVLDTRAEADAAVEALTRTSVTAAEVTLLHGEEGGSRLAAGRRAGGRWARTLRALSFMAVDQAVDLAWYEAALADGRAVVMVHAADAERRAQAIAALRRSGAHFMNHYGRFATEDVAPWRGAPPAVPWTHHR
ncbi:MAG TPA: hypothetical protein VM253_03280 [Candidatus Limnocylindrales bacterium]|nr:hypothetical protein [Candidatus Limnocylindrales bacterium]